MVRVHADVSQAIGEWLVAARPSGWDPTDVEVKVDNDEVLVVVGLPGAGPDCGVGAFTDFRERTRAERMALAAEAEERFGRKVSWGARGGGQVVMFTTATVPVMTRLRFEERATLDTLIDAGVARSRSEALAWCVRLVRANEAEWIAELKEAFEAVVAVRDLGPRSVRAPEEGSG